MELDEESQAKIEAMTNAVRALRNDLNYKTFDFVVGGLVLGSRSGVQSHDGWIDSIHNNGKNTVTIGLADSGTTDKILITLAPGAVQPFFGMPFHHGIAVTTFVNLADGPANSYAGVVVHGRIKL